MIVKSICLYTISCKRICAVSKIIVLKTTDKVEHILIFQIKK